jgi:CspA family cold shock protein
MNGTIKNKTMKGFGFISVEGQSNDIFFHSNGLVNTTFDQLQEGDNVTFDIEDSPKGKNAVNVNRV